MRRLFLIRHGRAEVPDEPRYWGSTDVPLSDLGRRQAGLLAGWAVGEELQSVFVSPLQRALDTGRAIAETCGRNVCELDDLREIDFGEWEGLSYTEIMAGYPEKAETWMAAPAEFTFPGGESAEAFRTRVEGALHGLIDGSSGDVAVVAHGGVLRAAITHLCKWPAEAFLSFALDVAGITTFELYDDMALLKGLNDTCHLRREER